MNQTPHDTPQTIQGQIPGFVFRRWAMTVIKPIMSVLLVLALIAALPGLIGNTVTQVTGASPNAYVEPVLEDMQKFLTEVDFTYLSTIANPAAEDSGDTGALQSGIAYAARISAQSDDLTQRMYAAIGQFLQEKGAILFGMLALELLLAPMLQVALNHALLLAVRKREVTLGGGLSALRHAPKALLVYLWMLVRVYAWMLPGMALMLLATFVPGMISVCMFLMLAGMVVSMVLGVRAMLHYAFASVAFVDDPTRSPNACIRISWQLMRHRKLELFSLELSFIGWALLVSAVMGLGTMLFGGVIGYTLYMMANLLLTVYVSAAETCFYVAYTGTGKPVLTAEKDATLS